MVNIKRVEINYIGKKPESVSFTEFNNNELKGLIDFYKPKHKIVDNVLKIDLDVFIDYYDMCWDYFRYEPEWKNEN